LRQVIVLAVKGVIIRSNGSRQGSAHRDNMGNGSIAIAVTDLKERIGSLVLPDKGIVKCF